MEVLTSHSLVQGLGFGFRACPGTLSSFQQQGRAGKGRGQGRAQRAGGRGQRTGQGRAGQGRGSYATLDLTL